jgi:hypothetical protein
VTEQTETIGPPELADTTTGRPTKKTPQVRGRIIQAIEMGATRRLAALYAGIGETLLYEWQAEDAEFAESIKAAEARRSIRWLATIEKASELSWQAAAWKLERLMPDEYGRKTRTEVTGKDEGAVRIEHTGAVELTDVLGRLSPDVLSALAAAVEETEDADE